jgi:hypothetical protein
MYRIGDEFKAEFTKPEEHKDYHLGQYCYIFDDKRAMVARYVIEELTEAGLTGTILVTYGHKRNRK